MDDLPLFLGSYANGAEKNLILWYDYLNPTHSTVHRNVMRFVEGRESSIIQPVQSPRQGIIDLNFPFISIRQQK